MPSFLPTFIRLPLALLLVVLNVLMHSAVLLILAAIKALVPIPGFRVWISRTLVASADGQSLGRRFESVSRAICQSEVIRKSEKTLIDTAFLCPRLQ
jgi:hypothetical protein